MSIRIYALAKKLNVSNKVVLDALASVGIEVKTALGSIAKEDADKVEECVAAQKSKSNAKETASERVLPPEKKILRVDISRKPERPPQVSNHSIDDVYRGKAQQTEEPRKPEKIPVVSPAAVTPEQPVAPPPLVMPKPVILPEKPLVIITPKKPQQKESETHLHPKPDTQEKPKFTLPPALGTVVLAPGTVGGWKQRREDIRRKKDEKAGKKEGKRDAGNKVKDTGNQSPRPAQRNTQHVPPKPAPPKPVNPNTTGFTNKDYAANVRRQDYTGPMRRIADKVSGRGDGKQGTGSGQKSASGIILAPVPQHTQLKQRLSKEPQAMKPDAKLPAELLKATNAGELVKKHIKEHAERQKKKEQERKEQEQKVKGKPKTRDTKGRAVDTDVNAVFEANKKRRLNKQRRRNQREDGDDGATMIPRTLQRKRSHGRSLVNTAAARKSDIVIQLPATVKQFSEASSIPAAMILRKLLELGTIANINAPLTKESAELLVDVFDLQATVRDEVTLESQVVTVAAEERDSSESLQPRPPVVTVLGHVDHGKTTLLDYILHLNVVSGEKGGITQHIRAYRVMLDNGIDVTFVDTPGHEAFTEMRARGANCTDIVVLVIAADDGIMPQTEEAIAHAKAAGVPIVIALNKMDLPGMNADRTLQQLPQFDLTPSEWGGDTEVIRCSALTGMGIDKLLETVQIIAELKELKANPDRKASGMTLEATLEAGKGVSAKVLVQNGTLKTGDVVLCGTSYGRVRAMYDTLQTSKSITKATPSTPVNLIGLDTAPQAGSKFIVLDSIADARRIAQQREEDERRNELLENAAPVTLENLYQRMTDSKKVQTLNVIIRADVRGSIEAIRKELSKLEHPEVKMKILQASVGGITEGDVQLAAASDAIIVGFSVVPDENARALADRKKVQIRRYDIIYNLTDDIKKALEGMLKPVEQIKELGRAVVQQIFVVSRVGTIAGCRVTGGTIERDSKIRVIRDQRIIGEYPLDTLKREKDDVKEIREGYECGMKLKNFNDIKEGDVLEAFKIEEVARTF